MNPNTGEIAVVPLLRGSGGPGVTKSSLFSNKDSNVAALKIDGKTVRKVGEVEVGALTEGIVFSPDGKYIYLQPACSAGQWRCMGLR